MWRKLLTAGLLAASGAVAVLGAAAQAAEVRVLNWKGYGTDEPWAVAAFEKATGHKVVHDYFNSEQEMLTKLRTNPGAYDVVLVNVAYSVQAREENLIQPIDTGSMANVADVAPSMRDSELLNHDGKVFGVPWVWGLTSIAVNDKDVSPLPDSLGVLWDPAYKGKVTIRDDGLEAVQFAALATGQNINDIKDLDTIKTKLKELLPQINTYWSAENDWNQFMSSGDIKIGTYWSGAAARAKNEFKLPVTFVIPKEGAIGWIDSLAIPTGSKNVEGAKAFINYMIDPSYYV
ncbi:MAG: extracellular solute-binding protein, partial [Pseudomonadota bacterium]|nr:extracellular solute-binding protein [Pseudomonadota bacterium]